MTRAVRFGCILLLCCAEACGAELSPLLQDQWLGAVVSDVRFPDSLRKDLTSGLTNRILIRAVLSSGGSVVRQQTVEVTIRYDLWEETFATRTVVDDVVVEVSRKRALDDVIALLQRLHLPRLFQSAGLNGNTRYVVRADMLLNPIDRERMKQIRKWVRENSDDTPLGPDAVGARTTSTMSTEIFNKLFEQYASGADLAAAWRDSAVSAPFTLTTLGADKR